MIVGPYTAEFGLELLFWIPQLRAKFGDRFKDQVVVSRGGTDGWYPCQVINAYDVVPPDEFRALYLKRIEDTGAAKSRHPDELDTLIMERLGMKSALHPGRGLFSPGPYKFEKFPKPEPYPGLPKDYVATRFYVNDWFRGKPPKITSDLPVVGLRIKTPADNHVEADGLQADIWVEYDIHDSFRVLSQVIGNAKCLICCYGSMAFLGVNYGIRVEAYKSIPVNSRHTDREAELAKITGSTLNIHRPSGYKLEKADAFYKRKCLLPDLREEEMKL